MSQGRRRRAWPRPPPAGAAVPLRPRRLPAIAAADAGSIHPKAGNSRRKERAAQAAPRPGRRRVTSRPGRSGRSLAAHRSYHGGATSGGAGSARLWRPHDDQPYRQDDATPAGAGRAATGAHRHTPGSAAGAVVAAGSGSSSPRRLPPAPVASMRRFHPAGTFARHGGQVTARGHRVNSTGYCFAARDAVLPYPVHRLAIAGRTHTRTPGASARMVAELRSSTPEPKPAAIMRRLAPPLFQDHVNAAHRLDGDHGGAARPQALARDPIQRRAPHRRGSPGGRSPSGILTR